MLSISELDERLRKKSEISDSLHNLVRKWATLLSIPDESLTLEVYFWGHWDASYPHYRLTYHTKGIEEPIADGYSLNEIDEQVEKLADAIKEKKPYCRCKTW